MSRKPTPVYTRRKAESLRKRDAVRYRNSVEAAEMEADRLLHRAEEYRGLAGRLAKGDRPKS